MITVTESAREKIKQVLSEEGPTAKLRMFIQGGGCAGFSYGFAIEDDQNDDDFVVPAGPSTILIDAMSIEYLRGATVDFKDDLEGSRFAIVNPQATSTCGCGSSFSAG